MTARAPQPAPAPVSSVRQDDSPAEPGSPARRGRPSSRDRILDAAALLVAEGGAATLTYDALAERTGISKGGLLYNFPSKEHLLRAMIDRHVESFTETWERHRDSLPTGAHRTLRALVATHREAPPKDEDCRPANGMLAAIAENPELLDGIRAFNRELVEALRAEAADPDRAMILWLALEGLMMLQLFRACPLTPSDRCRVFAAMDRVLDGWDAAG